MALLLSFRKPKKNENESKTTRALFYRAIKKVIEFSVSFKLEKHTHKV